LTISVVLADANILVSRTLRDYFLYSADNGALEIRWSGQILAEMSRNLESKFGLDRAATMRLASLMNDYKEDALVAVTPEDLAAVAHVSMDDRDRHVLAAALAADADILLTDNVRHFPRDWMAEHDVELLSSAELLLRIAEQFPDPLRATHAATVRLSPKSESAILATLESVIGEEAADVVRRVIAEA